MDPASTGARQITKFLAIWLIETVKIQRFLDHLQVSQVRGARKKDVLMAFPGVFFSQGGCGGRTELVLGFQCYSSAKGLWLF